MFPHSRCRKSFPFRRRISGIFTTSHTLVYASSLHLLSYIPFCAAIPAASIGYAVTGRRMPAVLSIVMPVLWSWRRSVHYPHWFSCDRTVASSLLCAHPGAVFLADPSPLRSFLKLPTAFDSSLQRGGLHPGSTGKGDGGAASGRSRPGNHRRRRLLARRVCRNRREFHRVLPLSAGPVDPHERNQGKGAAIRTALSKRDRLFQHHSGCRSRVRSG